MNYVNKRGGITSTRPSAGYQGQTDHDIDQEGLRDTQKLMATAGHRSHDPHRPAITKGSAACQDCGGDCVDITWTETVTRSATVHRSELAEAVAAPGQDDDGHPMPEKLSMLYGDPWKHGDLAALLGELAGSDRAVTEENDPDVHRIEPAS